MDREQIMTWINEEYAKGNHKVMVIKGTNEDYPKYLVYTEDEEIRNILEMTIKTKENIEIGRKIREELGL